MSTLADIASSLGQAFGSGKTGALSIGAGATAVTGDIQSKLNTDFQSIGALLGKYGGSSFASAINAGAVTGAAQTQSTLAAKGGQAILGGTDPTTLYIIIAAAAVVAAWLYSKYG